MRRIPPAIFLFLLAPICGALIAGSSSPRDFFAPVQFLTLCLLYGGGALLVRELVFHWKGGWVSILVSGSAFGMIVEGLVTKSFFDPFWPNLGTLASYGRFAGVNWVWALELIVYQAIFGIGIPILITSLLYPERRHRAWLGKLWLLPALLIFCLNVAYLFQALNPYRPSWILSLGCLAIAMAFILLARVVRDPAREQGHELEGGWNWLVTGFVFGIPFLLIPAVFTDGPIPIPPGIALLVLPLIVVSMLVILRRDSGGWNWKPVSLAALCAGALLFSISYATLFDFGQVSKADPTGMGWIRLITLVLLVLFYWRVEDLQKEGAYNPQSIGPSGYGKI